MVAGGTIGLVIGALIGTSTLPDNPTGVSSLIYKDSWLLAGIVAGLFAAGFTWMIDGIKNRPRLQVYKHELAQNWFFPICSADKVLDHYTAPYRLVIEIGLENLSERPIAIREFRLEIPGYKTLLSRSHQEAIEQYTYCKTKEDAEIKYLETSDNGDTIISITQDTVIKSSQIEVKKSHLRPVFILEPYTAKEGFVFFPMCPEIQEDEIESILKVITTRGVMSDTVRVKKGYRFRNIMELSEAFEPIE